MTTQDATTAETVCLAGGLAEDMFPHLPPQIAVHPGKPGPDCRWFKAAFATLFLIGISKSSHSLNASAVRFSN